MNFQGYIATLVLLLNVDDSVQGPRFNCQLFPTPIHLFADMMIDTPDGFLKDDPEFKFLKEVMNFRDDAVQHAISDAIKFFNDSYGLGFSSPPNEQNIYSYQNARMSPFRLDEDIELLATLNNWLQNGNIRSTCYLAHEGGFLVRFSGDQNLHGTYGGTDGKTAGVTDLLLFGFHKIDACSQSPVIVQFQSASPVRLEPVDNSMIILSDVYSRTLGDGKSYGVLSITPDDTDPGKYHFVCRNTVTFFR